MQVLFSFGHFLVENEIFIMKHAYQFMHLLHVEI